MPPWEEFRVEVIPELLIYWRVLPIPVWKSPWTLSRINSFNPIILLTENLASLPMERFPIVVIPRTSPIWYPDPPDTIVTPVDTTFPLDIVIFAVAPLPLPVIVFKFVALNVKDPDAGVYPIPELITLIVMMIIYYIVRIN